MEREFVIGLDELTRLSVECHGCGTEVTFDLTRQHAGNSIACTHCQQPLLMSATANGLPHNALTLLKTVASLQGNAPQRNPYRFRIRQR